MRGGGTLAAEIMRGVCSNDLWYAMPRLSGRKIRLEPLTLEHAPGYLAAAGTGAEGAEVFRWMSPPRGALAQPVTVDDAIRHIAGALAARASGARLPYAQIDATSGQFAGTTSFYEMNPALQALGIGHTWLGKPWWRTGHNTESKLLMMTFAFETLGAARLFWHTDIYNVRSQTAIERLGAVREGVLRKHRRRRDGTWRDTVQYAMVDDDWPAAKKALTARLAGT